MKNISNKATFLVLSLAIISVTLPANGVEKSNYRIKNEIVNNEFKVDEQGEAILELVANSNYGFVENSGKIEFYDTSGQKVKSSFINSSGKWYYFDSNGIMVTGWQYISGRWYYFDLSGVKSIGWLTYKNNWYYLGNDGAMKTLQWINIDGNWYYFNEKGIMEKDTVVNGYKIDSNGIAEFK